MYSFLKAFLVLIKR